MKKRAVFLAAVLLLTMLTACLARTDEEEGGLWLWYAVPAERQSREVTAALDSCPYAGAESVPALLTALLAGPPQDGELISLIPPGTAVVSLSVDGGMVRMELSGAYGQLSGVDRTIADCCIALTLCQLPGVDGVELSAGEAGDKRVLRAEDVIFSGGERDPAAVHGGPNQPGTPASAEG